MCLGARRKLAAGGGVGGETCLTLGFSPRHVSGNPGLRPGKESVEHSSKKNLCCRSTVASWFGFKISAFF